MFFLAHVPQNTTSLCSLIFKVSPLIIDPETKPLMLFKAIDLASVMISEDISLSDLFDPRLFGPRCSMMVLDFLSVNGLQ